MWVNRLLSEVPDVKVPSMYSLKHKTGEKQLTFQFFPMIFI